MTTPKRPQDLQDETILSEADERLVARIRENYREPERSVEAGVAFQAALDARLEREGSFPSLLGSIGGGRTLAAFAALGVACAVAWGIFSAQEIGTSPEPGPQLAQAPTSTLPMAVTVGFGPTPEETLLGLTEDGTEGTDVTLPDEYEAIASLLLGEA